MAIPIIIILSTTYLVMNDYQCFFNVTTHILNAYRVYIRNKNRANQCQGKTIFVPFGDP